MKTNGPSATCKYQKDIPLRKQPSSIAFIGKFLTSPSSVGYFSNRCVGPRRIKFEMSRWGHGFWATGPVWSSVVLALTCLTWQEVSNRKVIWNIAWGEFAGQRFTRPYNLHWSRLQTWCLRMSYVVKCENLCPYRWPQFAQLHLKYTLIQVKEISSLRRKCVITKE